MKVVVFFSSYTGPYSLSWVVVGSGHVSYLSLRDRRFPQF
jgi:hypothetical protein